MKAVRSVEGGVALVDLDEPPGTGELLSMKATSICGSDLSYIRFGSRAILGHELAGIRGDGTPVVVEAIYGCMACDQCARGAYNLCPTHGQRALGISADGGMAEQFRVPEARQVPLPAGLELADASIVEPASVSWHALGLAGTRPDDRVAVVGAGALGLLAVAGARRRGCDRVALEARHPHQKEAGERLGADIGATGVVRRRRRGGGDGGEPGPLRRDRGTRWHHRRVGRALRARAARLDAALPPRGPCDPLPGVLHARRRPRDGRGGGDAGGGSRDRPHRHHPSVPDGGRRRGVPPGIGQDAPAPSAS